MGKIERLFLTNCSDESKIRLVRSHIIALDTETTGLETWSPKVRATHLAEWDNVGHGHCWKAGQFGIFAKRYITLRNSTQLFFNAKFDIPIMRKEFLIPKGPVVDVMLMAQMLLPDEKTKNLKHLTRKILKDPYLEVVALKNWLKQNKGKSYGDAPAHIIEPYNLKDAKSTLELFFVLAEGMDEHKQWHVLEREMRLMPIVLSMEQRGVLIDMAEVDRLDIETTRELSKLKDKLVKLTRNAKFNPNSQAQVVSAVYDGSIMPRRWTKKGKPKVDELSLLEQPSKIGSLVVKYRKVARAAKTYLSRFRKVDANGAFHISFNQGGARTGRFSSDLQNVPRPDDSFLGQLRGCIRSRHSTRLVFIDYDQIELRLTAHFSREKHMLRAINEGQDLHGETCKLIFGKKPDDPDWSKFRYLAKTLNFAVTYGAGYMKFRDTILKDTDGDIRLDPRDAQNYLDEYKSKHPGVAALFEEVIKEVASTGGIVNHYGRYCPVERNKPYTGVNYKIQGTAADFLKLKMFQVSQYLKGRNTKLLMTIHDELVFEVPKHERHVVADLVKIMEDRTTFSVPLTCSVSIGKNWREKKKLSIPSQA